MPTILRWYSFTKQWPLPSKRAENSCWKSLMVVATFIDEKALSIENRYNDIRVGLRSAEFLLLPTNQRARNQPPANRIQSGWQGLKWHGLCSIFLAKPERSRQKQLNNKRYFAVPSLNAFQNGALFCVVSDSKKPVVRLPRERTPTTMPSSGGVRV